MFLHVQGSLLKELKQVDRTSPLDAPWAQKCWLAITEGFATVCQPDGHSILNLAELEWTSQMPNSGASSLAWPEKHADYSIYICLYQQHMWLCSYSTGRTICQAWRCLYLIPQWWNTPCNKKPIYLFLRKACYPKPKTFSIRLPKQKLLWMQGMNLSHVATSKAQSSNNAWVTADTKEYGPTKIHSEDKQDWVRAWNKNAAISNSTKTRSANSQESFA